MGNPVLEKSQLPTPYFVNIPIKPEKHRKFLSQLPSYYIQTLQNLYETIEETTKPLLSAEKLKEEFGKLWNPFNLLRFSLNSYIGHMWQKYPKQTEEFFKEGANEVKAIAEKQGGLLLDKENTETLLRVLEIYISSIKYFPELWKPHDIREFPVVLYQLAVNLDLCVLSIIFFLMEAQKPTNREKQNLRTLILWANEYSLQYITKLSQLLRKQPKVNPLIREARYIKNLIISLRHIRKTTYISKETGQIVREE